MYAIKERAVHSMVMLREGVFGFFVHRCSTMWASVPLP